jgi:ABC-type phosphate/phosphonate transport system substrate-binding protein
LDRDRSLEQIWDDPDLLLAQTCGFPLATRWRGRLRTVATPVYDAPGCDGPSYRSVLLVRRDSRAQKLADLRGSIVAINEPFSKSGCNLLAAAVMPLAGKGSFSESAVLTGSHLGSFRAVSDGRASIAAIDVVTHAHLCNSHSALTEQLRSIGWTAPAPGLPFVTSV